MKLSDKINKKTIIYPLNSKIREDVLHELLNHFQNNKYLKETKKLFSYLNSNQFKDIEKFFETMPKLSHTVTVTNPNTKKENEIVLEGLQNFFV